MRVAPIWSLRLLGLFLPTVVGAQQPVPQQPFPTEVYQDFRGKPLRPEFRLDGPDIDTVAKFEAAGLRITLPKTRRVNRQVEVGANFPIVGDFEITATYELRAADVPTDGYGVGVSLNLATTNDLKTFLKISRVMRADRGSVYMAEYWTKGADDWRGPQEPTDVKSGQLRLVREGAKARCQAAPGPDQAFTTLFEKDDFPMDDIAYLRFQVTDGNKPGYNVDARLIDLRVRHGRAAANVNAPTQQKATPEKATPPETERQPRGWRLWALVLGLALALVFACSIGLFFYVRRPKRTQGARMQGAPQSGKGVPFACGACGQNLKAPEGSAGKKLKCGKCGAVVTVPGQPQGDNQESRRR